MNALRISSVSVAIAAFFFTAVSISFAQTAVIPTVEIHFSHDLRVGASGADVAALQNYLTSHGFLQIPAATGFFGVRTRQALSAWQAQAGVSPASGFFGPLSRQHMNMELSKPSTALAPDATSTIGISSTTNSAALGTIGMPVRLKIPQLNIDAPFIPVGLTAAGAMDAPHTLTEVGWYSGGVHPGEIGTAVADGHVAQIRGGIITQPGVFSRLNELHAGDTFSVTDDAGKVIPFVVRESRLLTSDSDTTTLFTSHDGKAHLNIITCDGIWNPALQSYSQRFVIFADGL